MKKSATILLGIIGCIAAGAFAFAVLRTPDTKSLLLVAGNAAPVPTICCPASTATAAQPSPAPVPQPLGIKKQALTFAQLAPTTTMSFAELVGDNGVYEDADEIPPLPPADTYKLVINVYWQFATVYRQDENGEYTIPVRYIVVSSGSRKHPTPRGTFTMGDEYVRFGLFASYDVYGQYWRQITGNIYCHSLIYSSRNANYYTSSYNHLGTRVSHGCVRMMVPDARWIYYNLAPGTTCEIITGDKKDTQAAAIKAQLVFAEKPDKRPGLAAGKIPVSEAWAGWSGNAYDAYQAYLAEDASAADAKG